MLTSHRPHLSAVPAVSAVSTMSSTVSSTFPTCGRARPGRRGRVYILSISHEGWEKGGFSLKSSEVEFVW